MKAKMSITFNKDYQFPVVGNCVLIQYNLPNKTVRLGTIIFKDLQEAQKKYNFKISNGMIKFERGFTALYDVEHFYEDIDMEFIELLPQFSGEYVMHIDYMLDILEICNNSREYLSKDENIIDYYQTYYDFDKAIKITFCMGILPNKIKIKHRIC